MERRRHAYLEAMGITAWERRLPPNRALTGNDEALHDAPAAPDSAPSPHEDIALLDWDGLNGAVADCRRCEALAGYRRQTVFGVGNRQAALMVVGEAPGEDEDRLGEPFVGRAGKLLDAMLAAVGHSRGTVYIANILKCRPPNNRDPLPEEAAACEAYLQRQIALVRPHALLAVGRVAAQMLLKSDQPIGRLRGTVHRLDGGLPLVVTYHPAYLLRTPADKHKSWADLRLVLRVSMEER